MPLFSNPEPKTETGWRTRLRIDRTALAANYRAIASRVGPARIAPVVKADGYGLGAGALAPRLEREGARAFFVAQIGEGETLRAALRPETQIFLLNGLAGADPRALKAAGLAPVLNTLEEIAAWAQAGGGPCALHIDTGMNRLGLSLEEAADLFAAPSPLEGLGVEILMSHLACGDTPDHSLTAKQRARFQALIANRPAALRNAKASLSNTAGCLLDPAYHFDLVRPGIGLYGGAPGRAADNPFQPVTFLEAPILQVRHVPAGESYGYGATFETRRPTVSATVALGYADGLLRAGSNAAHGRIADARAPIIGRVSMDLIALDVTDIAPRAQAGDIATFLGSDLDRTAEAAGTIGYELLTRLGNRFERVYEGAP